ncbi:MAG TPA: NAD-dependent epimerase/dehydratase family protein [Gemmatimonadales bacterium]|nr:NAD-dependent epimerase/dehydratase family protein [Gemmatimonadales bacterium]
MSDGEGPSTIGITGATGFVGRYLVPWLAEQGFLARPVSARSDLGSLRRALAGVEVLVHLAGRAHVLRDRAVDAAGVYHSTNAELTRQVLEAAAAAGVRGFVFASSVKAVGERSGSPWSESVAPHPAGPYGRSKLEAERIVAARGAQLGLRTVILRFPLIYGPGMRANMLRLFRAIDRGVPLPLGRVRNQRSLLYVGNAAAAIEAALRHPEAGSDIYFVSDGRDLSTPELIRAIGAALGRPARLLAVPAGWLRLGGRAGDQLARFLPWPYTSATVERLLGSLQVDITRIRERLGYSPPFTLEDGLRATAEWYRSSGGGLA